MNTAASASIEDGPTGATDRRTASTAGTIDCPDAGAELTEVPEAARAEVDGQLATASPTAPTASTRSPSAPCTASRTRTTAGTVAHRADGHQGEHFHDYVGNQAPGGGRERPGRRQRRRRR
ncbi:hypothetical protein ACWD4G_09240 [Streptomyces sp. NPDC002643]